MSTQAQIDANRRNAPTGEPVRPYPKSPVPTSNTTGQGPKTEAGRAKSSRDATKFGLFSTNNCVLPGEEELYDHFCHSLWDALAPVGPIEELTAGEYVRATWLLRRCAMAAAGLGRYAVRRRAENNLQYNQDLPACDSMLCDDCLPNETAIGRARAQGFNIQRRAKADLDKLQAERRALAPQLQSEPEPTPAPPPATQALITEPTQSDPIPQSDTRPDFPCPCGSALQIGECCGKIGSFKPPLRPAA